MLGIANNQVFTSRVQRLPATLLCFIVASTLIMCTPIYVDSISLTKLNESLSIGPVGMIVHTTEVNVSDELILEIQNISDVYNVATLEWSFAFLRLDNEPEWTPEYWYTYGRVRSFNPDYPEAYSDIFSLIEGRFPENETEIAVSLSAAAMTYIEVGTTLYYSFGLNEPKTTLTVVGLYNQTISEIAFFYFDSIAVVDSSILDSSNRAIRIDVEIDKTPIQAFNIAASQQYLVALENKISSLIPTYYSTTEYSEHYVTNLLLDSLQVYIEWKNEMRISQISRTYSSLLLAILLVYLGVSHDLNHRETEVSLYLMRGSSRLYVQLLLLIELMIVSVFSLFCGLLTSTLTVKIGLASPTLLSIDQSWFFSEPLYLSLESLIYGVFLAVALPITILAIIETRRYSVKKLDDAEGRLARTTKWISQIRLDAVILLGTFLLIGVVQIVRRNYPNRLLLELFSSVAPVLVFLAIARLSIRFIHRFSLLLSRLMSPIVGGVIGKIGIRRLSTKNLFSRPVLFSLLITLTITITSISNLAILPYTQLTSARFAIGADVTASLSSNNIQELDSFITSVNGYYEVDSATIVSTGSLYLSEGGAGRFSFVAISPDEYARIGFDLQGSRLNESMMKQSLIHLNQSISGAIITEDIARKYDLEVGNTLRTSTTTDFDTTFEFEIVQIYPLLPLPAVINFASSPPSISMGLNHIWLNRLCLSEYTELNQTTKDLLCIGMKDVLLSEALIDALAEDHGLVINAGEWSLALTQVDRYASQDIYGVDSAIDTMQIVTAWVASLLAIIMYEVENTQRRQRNRALLRILGTRNFNLYLIQIAEVGALCITCFLILLVYGPLNTFVTLDYNMIRYGINYLQFPIGVVVQSSINSLLLLFPFLLVSMILVATIPILRSIRQCDFNALDIRWDYSIMNQEVV